MRYAKHAVRMSRTRRLLPVAWRKEEVPKELRDLTYLEVKEGQEEELAKDIRDWIGGYCALIALFCLCVYRHTVTLA